MYRREYVKPKNVSFSPRVQKANKARQSSNVRHLLCCKVFAGGQHYKTASMRLAGIPAACCSQREDVTPGLEAMTRLIPEKPISTSLFVKYVN